MIVSTIDDVMLNLFSLEMTTDPPELDTDRNTNVSVKCLLKFHPQFYSSQVRFQLQKGFRDKKSRYISDKHLKGGCAYSEQEMIHEISQPEDTDSGAYRCRAKSDRYVFKSEHIPLVFAYKVIPYSYSSVKTYLKGEVEFSCTILGVEPSKVSWFKGETELGDTSPYSIKIWSVFGRTHKSISSSLTETWNRTTVEATSSLHISPDGTTVAEVVEYHCRVDWTLTSITKQADFSLTVHGTLTCLLLF